MNYFINRVKPYSQIGRFQDEAGSDEVASKLATLLLNLDINLFYTVGSIQGYDLIVTHVLDAVKEKLKKI
jgi:hypothetical protein